MRVFKVLFSSLMVAAMFAATVHAADMKPEELIAKHLDAIGSPEARKAVKSRALQGQASMTIVMGGSGTISGDALLDSTPTESLLRMNLDNSQYKGEQFTYDGKKVNIAMFKPGTWSPIGMFMKAQSDLIKEGLFGGVLTTDWALLDVAGKNPKLSYDGLKTVKGKSLHQLSYRMRKGGGDVSIRLYFEPDTFRHVSTLYTLTRTSGLGNPGEMTDPGPQGPSVNSQGMGSAEVATARQQVQRLQLEETFSDFVNVSGLTLPTTWKFTYTNEGVKATLVHEYLVRASRIENNASLQETDFKAREFPAKK